MTLVHWTKTRIEYLLANWENRTEIVHYCVGVVDASMEAKRQALAGQDPKLDENRRTASSIYTDEVKVCSFIISLG